MSKAPNLFILGAPKCGTTALSNWLALHPEIFVPRTKEPHHFSVEYCLTPNPDDYLSLYSDWGYKKRWAVDASVWSLYSPTAVPNMVRERPDSRFIVMLRNPVQMIPSMHSQQVFNGNELELDLQTALSLSDRRENGEPVGVLRGYPPEHLAYFSSCALGWQVKRLCSRVDENKVHFIFQEDLNQSPEAELASVFEFLGLYPVIPEGFEKINVAKVRRFALLDKTAKRLGDWKHNHNIKFRLGLLSWVRKVNRKDKPNAPLTKELQFMIRERLIDDVRLLGRCTDRELSQWLQ